MPVSVSAPDPGLAQTLCGMAGRALTVLASCNIRLAHPVRIEIVETLPSACLGLYHCGEDRVSLLTPEAAEERRRPNSLFRDVDGAEFYASILVHELAHAAFDAVPCPFESCEATDEYLGYAMQIRSLPPADIAAVEAALPVETPVRRDDLSAVLLHFAPDRFAAQAWAHFSALDAPCDRAAQIMAGDYILDRERP